MNKLNVIFLIILTIVFTAMTISDIILKRDLAKYRQDKDMQIDRVETDTETILLLNEYTIDYANYIAKSFGNLQNYIFKEYGGLTYFTIQDSLDRHFFEEVK